MNEEYSKQALANLTKDELVGKTLDFLRELYRAKTSVTSPGRADDVETPTAAERYFDLCDVLGLKMIDGMLPELVGCRRNLLAFTVGCALLDDYYCDFFNEREIQIELLEKDDPKSLYARGWIGPDEYELVMQEMPKVNPRSSVSVERLVGPYHNIIPRAQCFRAANEHPAPPCAMYPGSCCVAAR